MTKAPLVSIHGGHSGQFCSHAEDTLEEVICTYIAKKFTWVGITEHMPPVTDHFMYEEERNAGFNSASLLDRFDRYITQGRRLQNKYADQLQIFIGIETEMYTGALDLAGKLIHQYKPDYVLGSIHHVADIAFDAGLNEYRKAVTACNGITSFYCRYFDLQYEMMQTLSPKVIAHFDLIRIFDAHYEDRWQIPAIKKRIERNLDRIAELEMILDYNVAALRKGAAEPYLSKTILKMAIERDIAIVPGDDSHGCKTVGACIEEGIAILKQMGGNTQWLRPV